MEDDRARTMVSTGPVALDLDERQYEAGYGPCMDAATSSQTIEVDHREGRTTYPGFSQAARRAGISHTVSVGLPVAQRVIGGLNIYGSATLSFGPATTELAETFAGYAAIAIANARLYSSTADLAANMRTAMESRAVIEQAKGIIMARDHCSSDEAFALLARTSQDHNQRVRDLAAALVEQVQASD